MKTKSILTLKIASLCLFILSLSCLSSFASLQNEFFDDIREGLVDKTEKLLTKGANVHGVDHKGSTPLHLQRYVIVPR